MAKKSGNSSILNDPKSILKNKYFITFIIFLVWIVFFDKNNILAQLENRKVSKELQQKKENLEEEIKLVEDETKALDDPKVLEKVARERYHMKKENEDVYIIIKE